MLAVFIIYMPIRRRRQNMQKGTQYTVKIALIAALGGFLMGFDASVISLAWLAS